MPEENYGNLGVTVPTKTDKPIAIPSAMKTFADSVGKGKGKGKLLIAQNTGGALFEAMKGDATLAEDGTLRLSPSKIQTVRKQVTIPGTSAIVSIVWPIAFADSAYTATSSVTYVSGSESIKSFQTTKNNVGMTVVVWTEAGATVIVEAIAVHD